MKILKGAQLYMYRPRKDKTVSITFITQEQTPEEVMYIHTMLDTFGYLLFKAEETLTKEEINEIDTLDTELYDNPKTQAQRLRAVLYRNFEQDAEGFQEFKEFYKNKTEQIIQHYKDKLDQT